MSIAELKQEVERLSPAERQEIAVVLSRLMDVDEAQQVSAELARAHSEMDAGRQTTLEQLRDRHEELRSQGR